MDDKNGNQPTTVVSVPSVEKPVAKNVMMSGMLDCDVEEAMIASDSCNGEEWSVLDLSCMSHLRVFQTGDACFKNVKEVKLIGLNTLERVVIGEKCFRRDDDEDKSGCFYLKDCEQLRELKIGWRSFEDYSVCEIENVPLLEGIEVGVLNQWSGNFWYASQLELKSDGDGMG